jgi:hypothetical protein
MTEKLDSELLFEMKAKLLAPIDVGEGPLGHRLVVITPGGRFEGPRLRGEVVAHSGGDWLLMRSDGIGALDVRINLRTDDGADIYMSYLGRIVAEPTLIPQVLDFMQPGGVDPSHYYFRTNPLFETGAAKYRWLNGVVAIGYGRTGDGGVSYRVMEIK